MNYFDIFALEKQMMANQQQGIHQFNNSYFQAQQQFPYTEVGSDDFFKTLEKELPPVFSRQTASKILGGLISAKTMANADANGTGPEKKIRIGSKVGYEKESFLCWLRERLRQF